MCIRFKMRFLYALIFICIVTFSASADWKEGKCGSCLCQQGKDKYGSTEYVVNCSSRSLRSVPKNLPKKIHIIDLSDNKLRSTESLNGLKRYSDYLYGLSIANNQISRIDPSLFSIVRNLEELDLSGNILDSVNGHIFHTLNLRKLIGIHAKTFHHRSLQGLVGLEVLSIVFESKYISSDIFDKLQVFQLNVRFKTAKQLPASIFKFGSNTLTTLSITAPNLLELPEDIFEGLSVLKSLYIEGENIHMLPDTLFFRSTAKNMPVHLYNLTVVGVRSVSRDLLRKQQSLRHAKLRHIMDIPSLNLPSQIDSLDFRDSNVFVVPSNSYSKLSNLRQLVLSNVSLSSLENMSFYGLTSLSFLDLSKNDISILPTGLFLSCHHSLEVLDLSYNKISSVTRSYFSSVISLQVLDLSFNMIGTLDENAFGNLNVLTTLRLTGNSIAELTETLFTNVDSLNSIHLNQNKLSKIPGNIFADTRQLFMVALDDNPLFCDCNITKIKQIGRYLNITGMCFAPPVYKGKSVNDFEKDHKTCMTKSETTTTKKPPTTLHPSFSEPWSITNKSAKTGVYSQSSRLEYLTTKTTSTNYHHLTHITAIQPTNVDRTSISYSSAPKLNFSVPMKESIGNDCHDNGTLALLFYISATITLISILVASFVLIRWILGRLQQRGDYVLPPPKRVPFTLNLNKEL